MFNDQPLLISVTRSLLSYCTVVVYLFLDQTNDLTKVWYIIGGGLTLRSNSNEVVVRTSQKPMNATYCDPVAKHCTDKGMFRTLYINYIYFNYW